MPLNELILFKGYYWSGWLVNWSGWSLVIGWDIFTPLGTIPTPCINIHRPCIIIDGTPQSWGSIFLDLNFSKFYMSTKLINTNVNIQYLYKCQHQSINQSINQSLYTQYTILIYVCQPLPTYLPTYLPTPY